MQRPTSCFACYRRLCLPRLAGLLVVWLCLGALALGSPTQVARAQDGTPGTPWTGALGVSESVRQLMERQRLEDAQSPGQSPPKQITPRRLGNPNKKPSPDVKSSAPSSSNAASPAAPLSPQTVTLQWTAATLSSVNPTNAFPPDTMGAAGPTQFIVAANNRIVSFNKSTGAADGVLNLTTNVFFNAVRNGANTTDPRIRYDRLSGRWFITMINVTTPNRILIAVSSESAITGSGNFTFFFIPIDTTPPAISNTCQADYTTLGIDAAALYIGANNYCSSNFDSTDGYVVRKTSVLGAGPLVVTVFRNLTGSPAGEGPFAPQGVDHYATTSSEGYFIGVSNAVFSRLDLRRVSDPGGTPSISGNVLINLPSTTAYPLTVRHQGNTGGVAGHLDALDDRLLAAHLRNGHLWTAHNIGVIDTGAASTSAANRDAIRWYDLQGIPTGNTPSVFQSGTVFTPGSPGSFDVRNYWMPTIMVSGQGHAALGFSTAGSFEFINAGTVGRLASDALGTMQTPFLYTASSTAYNPPGDTGIPYGARRWGDYSYTSLDPIDDMTMWTIQEFCDAVNSYGLQVAKLQAPPPATPSSANQPAPQNRPNFYVLITGTSVNGSGFYDPGANPPAGPPFSHITATVSGGVVVKGVTYLSPTQMRLNISTVGAPLGAKNVTITNPDGQSATGNGILLVTAPTAVTLIELSAEAAASPWLLALSMALISLLVVSALAVVRRR